MTQLGLSLGDTARQLGVSTSGVAKAIAHAERLEIHGVNNVPDNVQGVIAATV